jgi:hypothetical protein
MVFLILTRAGFDAVRSRVEVGRDAVWFNAGVISQAEVSQLRSSGLDVTTFADALDVDDLSSDVATIAEHHPSQVIWVEAVVG